MNHHLSNPDCRLLRHLNRTGSVRIDQLCADFDLTPTAVRSRLMGLMEKGFVQRKTVRSERGRPYHVYSISDAGRRQLGDDYAPLAQLLWKEVTSLGDHSIRRQLMQDIRQAMVNRYRSDSPGKSVLERAQQLSGMLGDQGFEVEIDVEAESDQILPILREHTCPYYDLAASDRTICELEQSVFEELLGAPIELTQCCHDGHNCCEFEINVAEGA